MQYARPCSGTHYKKSVPSPSRSTRFTVSVHRERDGEASTKPSTLVAVDLVEAARIWGGQLVHTHQTKPEARPRRRRVIRCLKRINASLPAVWACAQAIQYCCEDNSAGMDHADRRRTGNPDATGDSAVCGHEVRAG